MKTLDKMCNWQVLAGAALLLLANVAQAQYVWVDEKGVRQFSDRGPPATTPLKKILKSPAPITDPVDSDLPPPKVAPAAAAAPTTAEREADYRKRVAAKAEQDKLAGAQAAVQAQRNAACNQARVARAQLGEGRRLRGPDGGYLDDAQRAQQTARASAILQGCE